MTETLKLITRTESWAKEAQPNVIEQLEGFLAMAKAGELVSVAMAGECVDGMIITGTTRPKHGGLMLGALSHLSYRLNKNLEES